MRYIKPDYYDDFKCVAGACPDTCCAGWQIMIDEDSLEYYGEVQGEFGKRLRNSIDWQEGAFYQCKGRCAFLNREDLCDIYTQLGEAALCHTCTNYPRHTEEYEGLRELSLSLSCPIAARMMLEQKRFPEFMELTDDAEEELEEEFEDFDLLLFTQLEDARNVIMKHLQETEGTLEEKLYLYQQFSGRMQDCIDREEYYEIDAVVRHYEEGAFEQPDFPQRKEARYVDRKALFEHIYELERLREEWTEVLDELKEALYTRGEAHYERCVEEFEAYLRQENGTVSVNGREKESREYEVTGQEAFGVQLKPIQLLTEWEQIGTQLFVFFLYTYFCGAVYDDRIYSKMALAVESVHFIRELYLARWLKTGHLTIEDYVELAYRYAREIEHSDPNLNYLEEVFSESSEEQKG